MKRKKKDDSTEKWSYKNDYPKKEICETGYYLAGIIASRLSAFKALDKHGYCPGFRGVPEWNKAIQKMIDAFELLKQNNSFIKQEEQVIDEGLELFHKHFRNLWD